MENAFNLNTQQADKLISFLSNVDLTEKVVTEELKKIDEPVPTNVSNEVDVETKGRIHN